MCRVATPGTPKNDVALRMGYCTSTLIFSIKYHVYNARNVENDDDDDQLKRHPHPLSI